MEGVGVVEEGEERVVVEEGEWEVEGAGDQEVSVYALIVDIKCHINPVSPAPSKYAPTAEQE